MNSQFRRASSMALVLVMLLSLFTTAVSAKPSLSPSAPVTFTILHTNDFHGQLEEVLASPATSSNPGMARVATIVKNVRTAVGADKVLLVDAGDEMQGSLLSNIKKGEPTIGLFNSLGYVAATFGNHEFDWGLDALKARAQQATYPFVTANIVVNDSGNCNTAGWTTPDFAKPYEIKTVGTAPNAVNVAFIGVTTPETPIITVASATQGLCFKDPTLSIQHYYSELKSQADVIVVLSHLGNGDGGYGYGIPIYGDVSLAKKLNAAGNPVNLIIGGHSHTNMSAATIEGSTVIAQAHYNGRKVGRADVTVTPDGTVSVTWTRLTVYAGNSAPADVTPEDLDTKNLINSYKDPAYMDLIGQEVGWTNVPLTRNYDGDSLMGYFVNDAVYDDLNNDNTTENDVDMVFNNPGGLRADLSCDAYPCKLTYGMMFSILPFGNATAVGTMTGEQILELLNQSASLSKGAIQPAGVRYSFYNYRNDLDPSPTATNWKAWSWGAFDPCVIDKSSGVCEPLDLAKTYRVATNEFLAPAGQDNFYAFKYMKNVTYWGDMLVGVNRWVNAHYTAATPYNGVLDGRINRVGNDTTGPIIPITILHHNDMHGNLYYGQYVGYTQLATLINQERAYNPNRTLLLNAGDDIQGDGLTFFYKSSYTGKAVDGTDLATPGLTTNPVMAVMNAMGYDAMTLGNHEFNFGSDVFKGILGQASFPVLQANIADDGSYGLAAANGGNGVQEYVAKSVGPEGVKVAIMGIGNHRVPNYELPSNIPGLTFSDPLVKAQELSDELRADNDVLIALTHIGFTEDPKSVEVDKNVDTNMAKTVTGLDAIIGGHSHTNPATGYGGSSYLPTYVVDPNGVPVIINQAYRYNNTLGEVFLGVRPKDGGGFEVVSRAGQYLTVSSTTLEDPTIKGIITPYVTVFNTYNNTEIGKTAKPIDTTNAYVAETNAANLQADAALFELAKHDITDVDFHLSGAMTRPGSVTNQTNWIMFKNATVNNPLTMKIGDMFTLMPYENSLVVLSMNGPQLKAVLERAYRNYYFYKYIEGYGGYSYYTTCMIDTNAGAQITYNDLGAGTPPNGNNVVSLTFNGKSVDFDDADTYYNVSTVNYLAAGSCNFNNSGVSLWPLNQTVHDTQYYVRDAVIDYVQAQTEPISPVVEGRLNFITDVTAPVITINAPHTGSYLNSDPLTIDFAVTDDVAGVKSVAATLDGAPVMNGDVIDLSKFAAGTTHTFNVDAMDKAYHPANASVTFTVQANFQSMQSVLTGLYNDDKISSQDIYKALMDKLLSAEKAKKADTRNNILQAFINQVNAQRGKAITTEAADLLIADVQWLMSQ